MLLFYRPTFIESDLKKRQNYYKVLYNFTCKCEACTKNFPTADFLPIKVKIPSEIINKVVNGEAFSTDYKKRESRLAIAKKICKVLEKNSNLYPCKKLDVIEGLFKHIFTQYYLEISLEEVLKPIS